MTALTTLSTEDIVGLAPVIPVVGGSSDPSNDSGIHIFRTSQWLPIPRNDRGNRQICPLRVVPGTLRAEMRAKNSKSAGRILCDFRQLRFIFLLPEARPAIAREHDAARQI